jgi:hypothetical protein
MLQFKYLSIEKIRQKAMNKWTNEKWTNEEIEDDVMKYRYNLNGLQSAKLNEK